MESGVIQHHHIVSAPARPFGVFSPVCVQPFLPVPEGQRKCWARVRVVMGQFLRLGWTSACVSVKLLFQIAVTLFGGIRNTPI